MLVYCISENISKEDSVQEKSHWDLKYSIYLKNNCLKYLICISLTSYSEGCFQLSLQLDGNFVLYSLSMPSEILEKPYFATGTMYWESKLMFTEAGYLYVQEAKSNNTFNLTKGDPGSNKNIYHMARIDYDGIFRLYQHLKNEGATSCGNCPLSWAAVQGIPDDICAAFATYSSGGGFCGPNSICTSANNSNAVFCQCPIGFSPMDQSNNWLGCKPNFALPSCDSGWEATKELVEFIEHPNTDWQFSDYNLLQGPGMNKSRCRQECLDDCLCVVVVYEDIGSVCWMKQYPLSNGRQSPGTTRISLIKLPKGYGSIYKKGHTETLVLALLLGSSAIMPQTQKGPKHERRTINREKVGDFFFFFSSTHDKDK